MITKESRLEREACKLLARFGCRVHKVSGNLYPGFPDRLVIHPKFYFYMELKTEIGALSQAQKLVIRTLRQEGYRVVVIRNLMDLRNTLFDIAAELELGR